MYYNTNCAMQCVCVTLGLEDDSLYFKFIPYFNLVLVFLGSLALKIKVGSHI